MSASLRPGLDVRVYGERVGRLTRDAHGAVHFVPDEAWVAGDQRPPLGLAFLADPRPRVVRSGVPPWFDNLLPEAGSALRQWVCRQRGIRDNDSGALLQVLGHDLPGAVELHGDVGEAIDGPPEDLPPDTIRFSLAGVQLKLSMLLLQDRFTLAARGETGRWIVKVPGERFPELPAIEAATMAWARAAGYPVPKFRKLPIESIEGLAQDVIGTPREAFAIERFDRSTQRRVHQEDFAQALDVPPAHKYGDSGPRRATYAGLTRLVGDASGETARRDFVERLAFVVASGNGDAHLKNWSFQWGQTHRPWLAPCYDLVTTIAWPSVDGWDTPRGPTLALSFGGTRRFASVDRGALRRFCERVGVHDAESWFMAALERVREAWPSVAAEAPARMRDALAVHWQRVPLLAELGQLVMS